MIDPTTDAAKIATLEADNARLRRLLDQRDAPGELRHRLRGTLALLRTIIRRSAETERDVDAYVAHLEDRLDAIVRAQASADEYGAVDLHKLLADELLHHGASLGDRLILSGPGVELLPRPGQVMALAIHELAVNSVEHGALGTDFGRIEVTSSIRTQEPDTDLILVWKETGLPDPMPQSRHGFGTEVLTHTLKYELEAHTSLALESDGLRCEIRFRLTPRIGVMA